MPNARIELRIFRLRQHRQLPLCTILNDSFIHIIFLSTSGLLWYRFGKTKVGFRILVRDVRCNWCGCRDCHVASGERNSQYEHDDVIKWNYFPRYWPFVREIHWSPVNSPHKGQWRGALMSSLICSWINGWVNNGDAGDLRRHRTHYDVTVIDII